MPCYIGVCLGAPAHTVLWNIAVRLYSGNTDVGSLTAHCFRQPVKRRLVKPADHCWGRLCQSQLRVELRETELAPGLDSHSAPRVKE